MTPSSKKKYVIPHASWAMCLVLAIAATSISLAVAFVVGKSLAGEGAASWLMSGAAVLAVCGAHLLWALCRNATWGLRIPALAIWLACLSFVAFLHCSFFLQTQEQAGSRRVIATAQSQELTGPQKRFVPNRPASVALHELTVARTEQARLKEKACTDDCSSWRPARVVALSARIEALKAEADEAHQWQVRQAQLESQRLAVREDVVITELSKLVGLTPGHLGLVEGLVFSLILEGMGCICWLLVLQGRPSRHADTAPILAVTDNSMDSSGHGIVTEVTADSDVVTRATLPTTMPMDAVTCSTPSVTVDQAKGTPSQAKKSQRNDQSQRDVTEMVNDVRSAITVGSLEVTVRAIRAYLKCSQANARAVCRTVKASG